MKKLSSGSSSIARPTKHPVVSHGENIKHLANQISQISDIANHIKVTSAVSVIPCSACRREVSHEKKADKIAMHQYADSSEKFHQIQTTGDIVINNYVTHNSASYVPDISHEIGSAEESLKLLNITSSEMERGIFDAHTLLIALTLARCSIEKHLHIFKYIRHGQEEERKNEEFFRKNSVDMCLGHVSKLDGGNNEVPR